MKYAYLIPVLLTAVLAGCSSISVSRDYDVTADFSALKTFAWQHESQPETGNPRIDNDLLDERIRSAVNATLTEKGFQQSEAAEADFLVAYFLEYKQRISGNSWTFGIGTGGYDRFGGIGYNTAISDYDEGCLTLDMIHSGTGKMVWRGVGRGDTYDYSDPEKVTRTINKAVSKILRKFPPEG